MSEPTLTAHQIAIAQTGLRTALGLPAEQFPLSSFIGMVSDEIEQLRARGHSDAVIAEFMQSAAGLVVSADDIGRHYAPPEARGKPPA